MRPTGVAVRAAIDRAHGSASVLESSPQLRRPMTDTGSGGKRAGRPRSTEAMRATLDAAAELLLAQGLDAVSMDAVARRAGVSKATIYRWWPTKQALALDALYQEWDTAASELPDTGSLRGDLLALIRPWVRRLRARPYARVIAALITEAHTDPAFALEYRARFLDPRREPARAVVSRAIGRGQLPEGTDVDLALDPDLRPHLPPTPPRACTAERSRRRDHRRHSDRRPRCTFGARADRMLARSRTSAAQAKPRRAPSPSPSGREPRRAASSPDRLGARARRHR